MLFSSYAFIFLFLPAYLLLWHLSSQAWLKGVLLFLSLLFYGLWGLPFLCLLILISGINYGFAILLTNPNPGVPARFGLNRKQLLVCALFIDFLPLVWFKYSWFLVQNISVFLHTDWLFTPPALPLGISFYTFIQVAWLVGIYRREITPAGFLNHLLFTSCFPYVISGPIVRWQQVGPQFKSLTRPSSADLAAGPTLFVIGLAKKAILADSIGSYADIIFNAAQKGWPISTHEAWLGSLCYTFQLYFDFSGYTDMALGLALLAGIKLPQNFNSPYKSTGIVDFWRRWHITLGTWLRDFLYIPLGGNRKGKLRQYLNLFLTMLLGGLWHGAGWTFLIWGALHGGMLAINHCFRNAVKNTRMLLICNQRPCKTFFIGFTFLCISLCWVVFRSPTLDCALAMYSALFGGSPDYPPQYFQTWLPFGLVPLCAAICWGLPNSNQMISNQAGRMSWKPSRQWAFSMALLGFISLILLSRQNTFLYFQF